MKTHKIKMKCGNFFSGGNILDMACKTKGRSIKASTDWDSVTCKRCLKFHNGGNSKNDTRKNN